MTLRLTCSGIFVFLWLLLIKDVCHAIDLQRYPDGVTTMDATDKCGTSGLESDPSVLTKISKLRGQEFWTGLGIYTQLTPWIEMLGCFQMSMQPSTVYTVSSPGLCQRECLTRYFGYNQENSRCSCFHSNEIQLSNGTNLSSCIKTTDTLLVLVYEIFNGTINTSGEENELCTTLKCTYKHAVVMDGTHCEGRANIQGLCEDGLRSTAGSFWGLQKNQTFENCWKKDKLLLHSNACLAHNITSFAWTNVFREETEVERILGDRVAIPKFCISANISNTGEQILNVHRQKCSTKLEWFVCKKDSTTDKSTYHTDKAIETNYGIIVGGAFGAVIVLLIGVTVILCKIRRIGIFKSNYSANTTATVFTKSVHDDKTNLGLQTQQQVHESYGLVYQVMEEINKTNDSYTQVQKVKRMEDTYTESANGEYDHLHNVGGRKLNVDENTYDSNAGVRNRNDPTYDTTTGSTGVDMENTYDHSFSNMKTYSEYDVSDSCL